MVLADEQLNAGANRELIKQAFLRHDEATSRETTAEEAQPTHRIVTRDGSSLLERIRFT